MAYKYHRIYKVKPNELINISYIENFCREYPYLTLLVEIPNTKVLTTPLAKRIPSNVLIRVAGGYDDERMARYKGKHFGRETMEEAFFDSVIYKKNELVIILEEIEKIESGLKPGWSQLQKVVYIYDKLKRRIMYDPKYEEMTSGDVRSLRGLITKKTVCAGYAIIFKELMDRNNIDCEYTQGGDVANRCNHAWNIITIDGKHYPIDLTWDNSLFRHGYSNTFEFLGQDVETFCSKHFPDKGEKFTNYRETLSQLDPDLLRKIYETTGASSDREYGSTTFYAKRNDGVQYVITQIDDGQGKHTTGYFRYFYSEIDKEGRLVKPFLLFSDFNLIGFINYCNFDGPKRKDCLTDEEYKRKLKQFREKVIHIAECVKDVLFSRENINDSLNKNTYYIGTVQKETDSDEIEYITNPSDIIKDNKSQVLFSSNIKRYKRSNGTSFVVHKTKTIKLYGTYLYAYNVFEMIGDEEQVLKGTAIYSEKDFFNDNRQGIADIFLSRNNLDEKSNIYGGYMGYFNNFGTVTYNPYLVNYFETSKNVDVDSINNIPTFIIPTFDELRELAENYDATEVGNSFIVRERKTGRIITDISIIERAVFANLWRYSASLDYYIGNKTVRSNAFSFDAEQLYNTVCEYLIDSCKTQGVIDTVGLLRDIKKYNDYESNEEIIITLFGLPSHVKFINSLFLHSLGINQETREPKALYTSKYAYLLVNDSKNNHRAS